MRNLETATLKLGIFHPHDSLSQALIAAALQRQIEVSALQADLNSLQARPGCAASQPAWRRRSRSARRRPVSTCCSRRCPTTPPKPCRRSARALIDGALRAEVPRLFLLGHWQWLVAPRDAGEEQLGAGLERSLTVSGLDWTLVEVPSLPAGLRIDDFSPRRRRRGSGGRQGVRLRRSAARRSPSRPRTSASACAWRPEENPPCPDPIPSARPSAPCCWPWPSAPSSFSFAATARAGVSGAWYDLVLAFVAVWLAFWPEAGVLARSPSLANALGLVLQVGATLLGCLLGCWGGKGIAAGDAGNPAKRSASSPTSRRGS